MRLEKKVGYHTFSVNIQPILLFFYFFLSYSFTHENSLYKRQKKVHTISKLTKTVTAKNVNVFLSFFPSKLLDDSFLVVVAVCDYCF